MQTSAVEERLSVLVVLEQTVRRHSKKAPENISLVHTDF